MVRAAARQQRSETPMLDEGLAEWAGLDFLRTRYGRAFWQRWFGLPIDTFELERAAFVRAASPPSSLEPAYRYRASTLSSAVYLRPALALETSAVGGRRALEGDPWRVRARAALRPPDVAQSLGGIRPRLLHGLRAGGVAAGTRGYANSLGERHWAPTPTGTTCSTASMIASASILLRGHRRYWRACCCGQALLAGLGP